MVVTSYVLENDKRFRQMLSNASEVCKDLRVPFGLISRDFYRSELAIFKLKGPGLYPPFTHKGETFRVQFKQAGVGVQRLSPKKQYDTEQTPYQRRKLKKFGFDYPLLVATGAMAAAITNPNARGSVNLIGQMQMVLGVDGNVIKYAKYHQSDDPRQKIPLRKFIFIGPEAPQFATSDQQGRLERWLNIVNDYVSKTLQKEQNA